MAPKTRDFWKHYPLCNLKEKWICQRPCVECATEIPGHFGHRPKTFCSDKCKSRSISRRWYRNHREECIRQSADNRKTNYERIKDSRLKYRQGRRVEFQWTGLSNRAKKKGLSLLSLSDFIRWHSFQSKVCVYCGIDEQASIALFEKRLSVDRKDNKLGYETENMVLACFRCNMIKGCFLTYDQMITLALMFFRSQVQA